jgi:hypothetical protein
MEREIDETGREVLTYPSGLKTGRIIHPMNETHINSSERGRELATVRHERVRKKVRRAILKATQEANIPDTEVLTASDAYAVGASIVWQNSVLNPDAYPRDQIEGLEVIGRLGDMIPNKKASEETPPPAAQLNLSLEAILGLTQMVRKELEGKKDDIIDGTTREG